MSEIIQPAGWPRPSGFSHAIKVPPGATLVFLAGQIGWDKDGRFASSDFALQFAQALDNVLEVLRAAGGTPQDIVRFTVFVTGKGEYLAATPAIGQAFRERMGGHYPAMSLVEVSALVHDEAKVEIECTAALEPRR